jgi:hypothetical protein
MIFDRLTLFYDARPGYKRLHSAAALFTSSNRKEGATKRRGNIHTHRNMKVCVSVCVYARARVYVCAVRVCGACAWVCVPVCGCESVCVLSNKSSARL